VDARWRNLGIIAIIIVIIAVIFLMPVSISGDSDFIAVKNAVESNGYTFESISNLKTTGETNDQQFISMKSDLSKIEISENKMEIGNIRDYYSDLAQLRIDEINFLKNLSNYSNDSDQISDTICGDLDILIAMGVDFDSVIAKAKGLNIFKEELEKNEEINELNIFYELDVATLEDTAKAYHTWADYVYAICASAMISAEVLE